MTEHAEILGRREQKKRDTRRAIRNAALDLALEHGLENLTVEAIAQTAGISPRTFFNYFGCKEDALVTQAAEAAAQVSALILERPADETPMIALRNAILASEYFGAAPVDRERALARQRLTQSDPGLLAHHLGKIAKVEKSFATALATRMNVDVEQDLSPQLLAAVAVGVVRVAVRQWVLNDHTALHELLEQAFDQVAQLSFEARDAISPG